MRTLRDFQYHISLHRERVIQLGMALAKSQFPRLHPESLRDFLRLHDYSKTITIPSQLSKYGYRHRELPVERLFQFYGKPPKNDHEWEQLGNLVYDINNIDQTVCENFFSQHRELSWGDQEDFYAIEKVADLVDRSLDPIAAEEFGHPMKLASEYVEDPYLARLSLLLESRYPQITKNLSFSSVS